MAAGLARGHLARQVDVVVSVSHALGLCPTPTPHPRPMPWMRRRLHQLSIHRVRISRRGAVKNSTARDAPRGVFPHAYEDVCRRVLGQRLC